MKDKIAFTIVKNKQLIAGEECSFHQESDILIIRDKKIKKTTVWCLECLYKMLKEHNAGSWNIH